MKKTLVIVSILAAMIILLSACGGSTIKVDESMNGQTIDAKVGDVITVALEGNPTTGYNWYAGDLNSAILVQKGDSEFKADSSLIGAGGMITLKFDVVGEGTTVLTLNYMRSWESVQPLETFNVTINVK